MNVILNICEHLQFGSLESAPVDFLGCGNIWINNTQSDDVVHLARYVILEALTKTAPGQLNIVGYDSDLSGIFAPFASLSAGENRQMEYIQDEKSLMQLVDHLWLQIQSVQNVIQGRAQNLTEFRRQVNRPIEGYKLIVLSMDMGLVENELRSRLSTLMRKGPSCGISFLVISTTLMSITCNGGADILIDVDVLAPNITVLEAERDYVSIPKKMTKAAYKSPKAEAITTECSSFMDRLGAVQLPVVKFDELHDMGTWGESSSDGITFFVGKYGVNDVEITIGDEINQRHNALITGAVGQGKSNLISVIIHSVCLRYSPTEVLLYLLDYKEGVTLKPFSNIGQDEYLPHARVLGLESDVSFGIAVLESLYSEYLRRMKLLKDQNVKSLSEYRRTHKDADMPRILVIIDEFQMMFGDDMQAGKKVADILEKSVRLFRAAGIHFILASQAIGGNMVLNEKRDNIFSQVPIRIAHKNSISESQNTLGINNPAAAFLRSREAIVNLDYGEPSQNRKTLIAYADEKLLAPIRKKWWEKARAYYAAPYVFESERRITVSLGIPAIQKLRLQAKYPTAIVGAKLSVGGEQMLFGLPHEHGRNIAIIGSQDADCEMAVGMMQSIAVSLAIQHPKGDARFLFCDFTVNDVPVMQKYPQFTSLIENAGYFIENILHDEFAGCLESLIANANPEEAVYFFGVGLDRWEYEKDPYNQGSPLKKFVEAAPSKAVHFIGWWVKPSNFVEQVAGFGSSDAFNSKIFLRVDERAVQSLVGPFVRWSTQNNRALGCDAIEYSEEITFIPYAPVTQSDVNMFRAKIWE